MGRESAGSVFVTVDGDYGPLIAKYAQAETLSRSAGQRMAGALGQGLNSGGAEVKKYFGLFDEGGRIISSTVPKLDDGAEAILRVGRAAKDSQDKAQSFVGVIPGLGRAAEHFINLLPGVGSAIMAAFPLLGAAALLQNLFQIGSAITRVTGNFGELTEEEKKNADATKQISTEWENLAKQFESGMIERAALEIGKMSSLKLGGFFDESEAQRVRARLGALTDQLKTARAAQQVDVGTASLSSNPLVAGAQALNPAVTVNRLLANVDWKQQQQKIKPLEDEIGVLTEKLLIYDRVTSKINADKEGKESADLAKQAQTEANRIAREAAAEQKREAAEVQRIKNDEFRQAREFMGLVREGRKITAAENKALAREEARDLMQGLQDTASEFEHDEELKRREIVATTTARNRAAQEGIRAAGIRTGSADEISALRIEQAYALQIAHTRGEELQYAKDIAAADEKSLSDRISNLQALKEYQQVNALYDEANRTDLEIERAKSDQKKQQIQDATRLAQLNPRFQLGREIAGIGQRIPGQLGGAIANGATGGGNIGKQVADALRGIGKDLLGATLTAAIQKLIVVTGVEAIATRAMAAIFGTAQITNTAATTANTVATIGQTTAMIATTTANVAGMTALALAVSANTTALLINAFVPKPLGFAAGGRPPVGVPSIIGESGPELFIPDGPGVIIPNVPTSGVSSQNLTASAISNSSSNALSIGALHLHGVHNVEQFARRLPNVLKARAPVFSPATR